MFCDQYSIVRVVWRDHYSIGDGEWCKIDEVVEQSHDPVTCYSIGFLLNETEDFILIAQTVTEDGDCAEILKILKPTVVEGPKIIKKAIKAK